MRLCLAFGEVSVDRLLASMTYPDLLEWMAYYSFDPWGEERADMRSAMQSMVTASCTPFRGKNAKAFKMEDFMLKFDSEPEKPAEPKQGLSPAELLAKAKLITAQVQARMRGRGPK